jgi:hypothetical protein
MASPPATEANQQLWDETLTRLLNLSTATVKRNVELETRLADLEVELTVWKQAHATTLEASERQVTAHNVQLSSLNRQISSLESFKNQSPLILCVLDGDGNIFAENLLKLGQQGGRQAAQQFTKGIAQYLSNEDVHCFGRLSFWVTIYFNKSGLLETLVAHNKCTSEQFEAFCVGFSQASPRFLMIDVGPGKEAADAKIREYLQTYTRFPQTLRVFFGGGHDNGYASTLTALENEQFLGKLVLLEGYDDVANELRKLALPSLKLEGLFMSQKLSYLPKKLAPLTMPGSKSVTTNGGLMSPRSPSNSSSSSAKRLVNPALPLHKQSPPPCNEYYLMSCFKGTTCKYSHDYELTPEQRAVLANNAKKGPCNFLKSGLQCPYGDKCCWGHACPNGPKCFHLSKGKCWFKGDAMHLAVQKDPQSP